MSAPYPPINRRTLCYFCYASAHTERWRSNLELLAPYLDQFDRRHLAFITENGTASEPTLIVADRFGWSTIKVIGNQPALRELPGWEALLDLALDDDPCHAILYAHARGASRPLTTPAGRGSWAMTRILARALLSDPALIGERLRWYHLVGALRRSEGHWIPGRPRIRVPWDYPGTWYWLRSSELYRRPWRELPRTSYTTEAMPGLLYAPEEGADLLGELPPHCYLEATWTDDPVFKAYLNGA